MALLQLQVYTTCSKFLALKILYANVLVQTKKAGMNNMLLDYEAVKYGPSFNRNNEQRSCKMTVC